VLLGEAESMIRIALITLALAAALGGGAAIYNTVTAVLARPCPGQPC
jgi:hypothetical protein